MAPFTIDLAGNVFNLFDTVTWWTTPTTSSTGRSSAPPSARCCAAARRLPGPGDRIRREHRDLVGARRLHRHHVRPRASERRPLGRQTAFRRRHSPTALYRARPLLFDVDVRMLVVLLETILDGQDLLSEIPAAVTGISRSGARSIARRGALQPSGDSYFRIASLTKTFTSAAVVLALRAHHVALNTPAIDLLPSLSRDWHADRTLTVEQLLGQVSGLRESVDANTMATLGDEPEAVLEGARLVVRAGNKRPPGARWSYYNGNYFLAGAILGVRLRCHVRRSPGAMRAHTLGSHPYQLRPARDADPRLGRNHTTAHGRLSTVTPPEWWALVVR